MLANYTYCIQCNNGSARYDYLILWCVSVVDSLIFLVFAMSDLFHFTCMHGLTTYTASVECIGLALPVPFLYIMDRGIFLHIMMLQRIFTNLPPCNPPYIAHGRGAMCACVCVCVCVRDEGIWTVPESVNQTATGMWCTLSTLCCVHLC